VDQSSLSTSDTLSRNAAFHEGRGGLRPRGNLRSGTDSIRDSCEPTLQRTVAAVLIEKTPHLQPQTVLNISFLNTPPLLTNSNFVRLTRKSWRWAIFTGVIIREPLAGSARIDLESDGSRVVLRLNGEGHGGFMEIQESIERTIPSGGNGHVQEVVRQAHEELRQLLQQRAEVMRRIGTIKQTIAGLANLFGDSVLSDELLELVDRKSSGRQPGFTKACRMILMDSNRALSARDVCNRIQERVPPMLTRHKDPMASVTTVLNRLVSYGEAKAVSLDNGRRAWRWVADGEVESTGLSISA